MGGRVWKKWGDACIVARSGAGIVGTTRPGPLKKTGPLYRGKNKQYGSAKKNLAKVVPDGRAVKEALLLFG
jgi:hypothetical protein